MDSHYNICNNIFSYPCNLNDPISIDEVLRSLNMAKHGKAAGIDDIKSEVLQNPTSLTILHKLFNVCFDTGIVPKIWSKGIINPLPKRSTTDPRDPLQYRGITLAPAAYKLYCRVLNERLTTWVESNSVIHDEQNGFRKNRSTVDHLISLTSIIESRKVKKQPTFCAFIDFRKAFDSINRPILWQKLCKLGMSGKMLSSHKSIYMDVQCCVRINGMQTSFFDVNVGVKQGCLLSGLLFNLYINDFITLAKALGIGVNINNERVCMLIYADDIVLLAETERDLQVLLDALYA